MVMKTDKLIGLLIGVVLFAALGGTIASSVTEASGNFTGAALILFGLTTLFVVIAFIRSIANAK